MKLNFKEVKAKYMTNSEPRKKASVIAENQTDVAQFVKLYRKNNSLSQDELAKFSNVSRLAISELETGKSDIKFSTLLKILNACSMVLEVRQR